VEEQGEAAELSRRQGTKAFLNLYARQSAVGVGQIIPNAVDPTPPVSRTGTIGFTQGLFQPSLLKNAKGVHLANFVVSVATVYQGNFGTSLTV
jgi:hypothetical protein